jgi:hypothetical protein
MRTFSIIVLNLIFGLGTDAQTEVELRNVQEVVNFLSDEWQVLGRGGGYLGDYVDTSDANVPDKVRFLKTQYPDSISFQVFKRNSLIKNEIVHLDSSKTIMGVSWNIKNLLSFVETQLVIKTSISIDHLLLYENCWDCYFFNLRRTTASGVKELNDNPTFEVYPNPTYGVVNIKANNSSHQDMNILLTSLDGRVVLKKTINSDFSLLDLNPLKIKHGMYLLKINHNGNSKTMKIFYCE